MRDIALGAAFLVLLFFVRLIMARLDAWLQSVEVCELEDKFHS